MKIRFKDIWWLIILLLIVPAIGAKQVGLRGVRWSYLFLTLAIAGLVARILWVAFHK